MVATGYEYDSNEREESEKFLDQFDFTESTLSGEDQRTLKQVLLTNSQLFSSGLSDRG